MIIETNYDAGELHSGTCDWCGKQSDELVYTDGGEEVCVDCIEAERFYRETMKGI